MRPVQPHPLGATVRILLLAVSALIIFGITAILCAAPLAWFKNNAHASAGIITLGVICGLICWLFVVTFHFRKESVTLLDDDHATLTARLWQELEELGYEAGPTHKGRTVFKPGFTAYLAGGAVHVTEQPGGVVVAGPRVFVERLRKRMKILQHITSVQQSIHDSRVRQGRHLLRRVEIDLRVLPDQWQSIHDDVLTLLARQEAKIVCEVHILAQNDNGIIEEVIELGIRERLRQQHIPAEIRKEARPSSQVEVNLAAPCVSCN